MSENVKNILETLLSSQEYFKEIKYSDDIGQFATMIDDFNELPAIGVFFNDYTPYDWQGTPMVACDLTFFVSCDMLSPTTEAETMQEFLTNVNAFISLLSPYIQARPKELRHFKDTVLRGVLISVNFLQNYSCTDAPTPPVPPGPEGEFYDMLNISNGANAYNVFFLPYRNNFEHCKVAVRGKIYTAVGSNNTLWFWRVGAWNRTDPTNGPQNEICDYEYNFLDTEIQIRIRNVRTGAVAYSTTVALNYGETRHNGFLFVAYGRSANNVTRGVIYSISTECNGVIISELRPFMTTTGVVGLKDTVTGEFFAPQANATLTVENENSRSLTLGTPENLDKLTDDGTTDLLKKSDSEDDQATE